MRQYQTNEVAPVSRQRPIRDGIIATVVGGTILAVLGALWPAAAAILTSRIPIPVWAVVAVGIGLVVVGIGTTLRVHSIKIEPMPAAPVPLKPTTPIVDEPALSDLERRLIARIAREDGKALQRDTAKRSLAITNLELDAAIDRLRDLDLVEAWINPDDEDDQALTFTARGRQYAVLHRRA